MALKINNKFYNSKISIRFIFYSDCQSWGFHQWLPAQKDFTAVRKRDLSCECFIAL